MVLRELQEKDAMYMLEWMKDEEISKCFQFDTKSADINRCKAFIENNKSDTKNRHYAIINEEDEYLGTISLKNIDLINKNAEYAIATRKKAHGTGISKQATIDLLKIAFNDINLEKVYLNVLSKNTRAVKFYEKIGFKYEGEFRNHLYINSEFQNLKWFSILKREFLEKGEER